MMVGMAGLLVAALEPEGAAQAQLLKRYPVRLGPLRFECLVGELPEALGDKLDAVGAVVVPGERSPRGVSVVLPVVGSRYDVDAHDAGLVLRRQVRALLNNQAWRMHGHYFIAGWDPETAAWLVAGSGQLSDEAGGFAHADWQLTLGDTYLLGRPGTHRRGRRIVHVDRADPSVPSDTRRMLFTTDLASVAPAPPAAVLPGDIDSVVGFNDRELAPAPGPTRGDRTLWSTVTAANGEIVTWRASADLTGLVAPEADVEELGGVRVWATAGVRWSTTAAGDTAPDREYGWERIVGELTDRDTPLAIDNGACRLTWAGTGLDGGLVVERADTEGLYHPVVRLLHRAGRADARVVEVTSERALIAWRVGGYELRAELRRGWTGPHVESYAPAAQNAALAIAAPEGHQTPAGGLADLVETESGDSGVVVARSHSAVTFTGDAGPALNDKVGGWSAPRVFTLSIVDMHEFDSVTVARARARWDVRITPTLLER